jgi:DNA-binding NtrC family response regulator
MLESRLNIDYVVDTKLDVIQVPDSGKILIAGDNEAFLRSTADLLRREGYECDCASDTRAVIEILRSARYDLLIADINTPGNFELELIKNLPKIGKGRSVILVTGSHLINTMIRSLQSSMVVCIRKPLDSDKLLAQVRISIERL